ncbi:MFS transporter [Olivibacter sp. CPCC 100613]|uniref:MFS transporter n=1 Tax=Olivibacter sp. CPCC 100613 TaxID=3079931 RepID=UPI002FF67980
MTRFLHIYLNAYRGLSRPAWMLALVMFINRSGAMVLPFLGVYMTNKLNYTIEDAGIVLSCFGMGAVSGSWLGGWLTDRFGHFKIQTCSLFLTAPLFFLLPQLQSMKWLAFGIFSLSLISETFRPANSVSIAHYAKPENITKAFSLNRMAINLGFSIGPALGGFLASISYDFLFYGNGITCLLAGILFFIYFKGKKGHQKKKEDNAEPVFPKRSPYTDVPFLLFSFLCALYAICFFQLLNTLPMFYRSIYQLTESQIGRILAFSGFVVFSLEMLVVHVAEKKLSTASVIIFGTLLCGFSYVLLNHHAGQWILYFSIFILCLSEILAIPFMATVTANRSGKYNQGAYMGLNALSFSIAHIISPYVGTHVAATHGFTSLWWGTGIITTITAVGFIWVFRLMKR